MGASLFSIGLTGLNAAQAGLSTTSHNISNAGTTGYSRQRIEQSTNPAMFTGAGFFGEGTKVDTVKRAYNSFLTNQVLAADTRFNEYDTFSTEISQIDNMLADPTVGLSPALQDFFGGIQEVAANPASVPARQSMLSTAESLVSRMHNLSDRLDEIRAGVEGQIKETVSQISTYAKNIAEVNNKITIAQQAGSAQPANDLLDTRDQLVKELNTLVRVSTSIDTDGAMSVFIGNGQPLVIGSTPTRLEAQPSIADQSRLAVNILTQSGAAIAIPESLLGGGKLGGLLSMRATLDSTQSQLGLVAVGLSVKFNAQHQLGQDLNGKLGTDFFSMPSLVVEPYAKTTTQAPTVEYDDVSRLTADDYQLTFISSDGGYSLTRISDGRSVSADQVGLKITPPGASVVGDSFLIQPTRHAASSLEVLITDTRMIAAGAPVNAAATASNRGTGSITAPVVTDTGAIKDDTLFGAPAQPFKLTYDAAGGTLSGFPAGLSVSYTQLDGTSGSGEPVPYKSGMTISVAGVSFSISGALQDQDSFTLGPNTSGVSDSRNAVSLGQLQTTKLMLAANDQPSATLQSVYSQLVSSVGNKAREMQVNRDAQESLVDQAYQAQQSVAGVSLDEEAANLIRYQQAYQAASKVMSIASKLFDEVLSLGR